MHDELRIFCVLGQDSPPEMSSWLGKIAASRLVAYDSAESFLRTYRAGAAGCVVASVSLPGMSGWDLQETLSTVSDILPVILIDDSECSSLSRAVQAARNGVCDLLHVPVSEDQVIKRVNHALQRAAFGQAQRAAALTLLHNARLKVADVVALVRENSPDAAADIIVDRLCRAANAPQSRIPSARRDWLRTALLYRGIEELARDGNEYNDSAPPQWLLEAAYYVRKFAQDVALLTTTEKVIKALGVARETLSEREIALIEDVAQLALRNGDGSSRRHSPS